MAGTTTVPYRTHPPRPQSGHGRTAKHRCGRRTAVPRESRTHHSRHTRLRTCSRAPEPPVYIAAKEIAGQSEIIAVGHSLGGGLAQFIAATYGLRGATFNAPPMGAHMERYSRATGQSRVDEAALKELIVNFRAFFGIVSVGSFALDAIKIVATPLMGMPRFNPAWARHLGRVVHLGPGAGLHFMDPMVRYIALQPYSRKSPWDVR